MAEYIRIENPETGAIVIDDNYRNFHLIQKVKRSFISDQLPATEAYSMQYSGYVGCHHLHIQSIERPIIATDLGAIVQIRYSEQSNHGWDITIFYNTLYVQDKTIFLDSAIPSEITYYIFGLLPTLNYRVDTELTIRNAKNEIVFSNAYAPMKVIGTPLIQVDYPSMSGISTNSFQIPEYSAQREYAIATACCACFYFDWGSGGLMSNYNSFITRKTVSLNNSELTSHFIVSTCLFGLGSNSSFMFTSDMHTSLILDVTGY